MNRLVWWGAGALALGAAGYWLYAQSKKSPFVISKSLLASMPAPAETSKALADAMTKPDATAQKPAEDDGCLPGENVLMCTIRKDKEAAAKAAAAQQAAHENLLRISSAYAPGIYPGAGTSAPSSSGTTRFV